MLGLDRNGLEACRIALRRRISKALGEPACTERWARRMRSDALVNHNDLQFLVELLALSRPGPGGLSPLLAQPALVDALGKLGERAVGGGNIVRPRCPELD